MDLGILSAMAAKAGLILTLGGGSMKAVVLPYGDLYTAKLNLKINQTLPVESHPKKWEEMSETILERLDMIPAYLVRYSIAETFATSVGVIHSINIKDQWLLVNAVEKVILPHSFAEFIKDRIFVKNPVSMSIGTEAKITSVAPDGVTSEKLLQRQASLDNYALKDIPSKLSELPKVSGPYEWHDFKLDERSLKNFVVDCLIQTYTRTVTYYGQNNVMYQKTCAPGKNSVRIEGITPIYVPFWSGHLKTLQQNYETKGIQFSTDSTFELSLRCGVCSTEADKSGYLLCNMCGTIVHSVQSKSPPRRTKCSFLCKLCGTTLCRRCTYRQRRFLIFTRYLCQNCADKLSLMTTIIRSTTHGNPFDADHPSDFTGAPNRT